MGQCLYCKEEISGRTDKKYCSPYCKSSYHYQKNKSQPPSFYEKVDKQLKLNRMILKEFNKAGLATVRKEVLTEKGFNPKFFTHYWKNKNNDIYLFCYEFGFLSRKHNNKEKYVLIKWQDYMEQ